MAWSPVFYNEGLFNNTPEGNITVPVDNARQTGNVYTDGEALFANYHSSDTFSEDFYTWSNAKGKSFSDKLLALLKNNINSTHSNVDLAVFTIKNPEHAQFYKQELAFIGYYSSGNIVRTEDPETGAYIEYFEATVGITKIARREWATPYATQPTTTEFVVANVYRNFNVVLGGKEFKYLEWLYNFYDEGIFCAGQAHYNNKYYFMAGFYTQCSRTYDRYEPDEITVDFAAVGLPIDYLEEYFGGEFEPEETEDPNEEPDEPGGGESEEGGGEGDHDDSEDDILDPGLPPIGAADAGFVHMFHMSVAEIQNFAHDMFDPNIWQAIKDFFADPMDFIAGVLLLPFTPEGSEMRKPKFGNNVWANAFELVSNQFYRQDMGTIHCKKYYDSFLDFDSFTKIKLYLPYIGYKDLLADECMGKDIHVYYNIDCGTGDCVAFVEINGDGHTQIMYQFQGNCAVRVPYGRQSFDAAVSSSLQLMGGLGSLALGGAMLASGGLAGATAGIAAAQIAGQVGAMTADAVNGQKRTMERAGSLGASAGYMGVQYPYLIRQIPNQSRPGNYKRLHGYPANLGGNLGSFPGFTSIESIKLSSIVCTDEEKNEILELLRGGVFV